MLLSNTQPLEEILGFASNQSTGGHDKKDKCATLLFTCSFIFLLLFFENTGSCFSGVSFAVEVNNANIQNDSSSTVEEATDEKITTVVIDRIDKCDGVFWDIVRDICRDGLRVVVATGVIQVIKAHLFLYYIKSPTTVLICLAVDDDMLATNKSATTRCVFIIQYANFT